MRSNRTQYVNVRHKNVTHMVTGSSGFQLVLMIYTLPHILYTEYRPGLPHQSEFIYLFVANEHFFGRWHGGITELWQHRSVAWR